MGKWLLSISLVFLLGHKNYSSLFRSKLVLVVDGLPQGPRVHSAADRMPAAASEPYALVSTAREYHLGCGNQKPPQFKANTEYLQLGGKLCLDDQVASREVKIFNENNGGTIDYFELPNGRYQTDLIFLSRGENRLRIQGVSRNTHKKEESEFWVVRVFREAPDAPSQSDVFSIESPK